MNLVTGATGIVGSHVLLSLLKDGKPVVAGKQAGSDIRKVEELFAYYGAGKELLEKIRWVELDVRDIFSIEEALKDVTNVYHCAGFVSFNPSDRKKLKDINETGTKNMVDACLHKGVQALCHVSTIGTVNNLDHTHTLDESVFWKTSGKESEYAWSKYNAEREVWRGMEEGLNAVIVNPGLILAPGFWSQSSSKLFDTCYKGNRFYTGGISGYVAASDVAFAMVQLMEKRQFGERYILVENNYTFHTILSEIQSNLKKPVPVFSASPWMLKLAGRLEKVTSFFTGAEPKITKALVNSAFNTQLYANEKIKKAIGIEFIPVLKVIEDICRYYLREKAKV